MPEEAPSLPRLWLRLGKMSVRLKAGEYLEPEKSQPASFGFLPNQGPVTTVAGKPMNGLLQNLVVAEGWRRGLRRREGTSCPFPAAYLGRPKPLSTTGGRRRMMLVGEVQEDLQSAWDGVEDSNEWASTSQCVLFRTGAQTR